VAFRNPIVGGTALIRDAIESPDYAPGSTGWTINRNGTAEFNDLTVRGTFAGSGFDIMDDGEFFYSPSPGPGNLVGSWANNDGTDQYGNHYYQGLTSYADDEYVQIISGAVYYGVDDGYPGAPSGPFPGFSGVLGDSSAITHVSAGSDELPETCGLELVSGSTYELGQPGSPHAWIDSDLWLHGAIRQSYHPSDDYRDRPYTWQTPSYASGWADATSLHGNLGFQPLRYHRLPGDTVWLYGAATYTGTGTAGTLLTLPAAGADGQDSYRPPAGSRAVVPCYINHLGTVAPGFVQVTEGGAVAIGSTISGVAIASGDEVFINGHFSLRLYG